MFEFGKVIVLFLEDKDVSISDLSPIPSLKDQAQLVEDKVNDKVNLQ